MRRKDSMRRLILLLTWVILAAAGAAAAGETVEFITDVTVQAREMAPSEAQDAPEADEGAQPFVIEDATVTESGPAADVYTDLARGAQGEDVIRIQQRLMQLGYLPDAVPDGTYGRNTCAAMHNFKAACGIDDSEAHNPEDCPADAASQAVLFSDAAVPYNDPAFPAEIAWEAGLRAKEESDYLICSPTVRNLSQSRTIASVTVDFYVADLWGNRVGGEEAAYIRTSSGEIAPGAQATLDRMTIPGRNQITWLYAAVTEITFTDGTTRIAAEPEYVGWTPTEW